MSTLTTQQKNDIDKLWTEFWTGGITNPPSGVGETLKRYAALRANDMKEKTNFAEDALSAGARESTRGQWGRAGFGQGVGRWDDVTAAPGGRACRTDRSSWFLVFTVAYSVFP